MADHPLEHRLRIAMYARAAEVVAGPELRRRIHDRIESRGRRQRTALVGLATAAAAVGTVVVLTLPDTGPTDVDLAAPPRPVAPAVDPDAPAVSPAEAVAPGPAETVAAPAGPMATATPSPPPSAPPGTAPSTAGSTQVIDLRAGGRADLTGTLAEGESQTFRVLVGAGDVLVDADGDGTRPDVVRLTGTVEGAGSPLFADVASATERLSAGEDVLVVRTVGVRAEPTAFAGAIQFVPVEEAGAPPAGGPTEDAVDPAILDQGEYAQVLRVALDGAQVLVNTTCRRGVGTVRMNLEEDQGTVMEVDDGGTVVQVSRDGTTTLSESTTVVPIDRGQRVTATFPEGAGIGTATVDLPTVGDPGPC